MSNWFPVGKSGAKTTYTSKAACETAEGQACYDITGKDLRWHSVDGGVLVEDPVKKAMFQKLDELAASSKLKYVLGPFEALERIQSVYDELVNLIHHKTTNIPVDEAFKKEVLERIQTVHVELTASFALVTQHLTVACKTVKTVGGSVTEEFLDSRVKAVMHCRATMTVKGGTPVIIETDKCEDGKVVIVFSADPGNDHELTYNVCL